jgi:hypothetical protein
MEIHVDFSQSSGRRQAIKAAVAALAAVLGRPLRGHAAGPRLELRYYRTQGGKSELIYAEPMAVPVVDELWAGDPGEIEMKWFDGRGSLLGSARLPAEVRAKLQTMRS